MEGTENEAGGRREEKKQVICDLLVGNVATAGLMSGLVQSWFCPFLPCGFEQMTSLSSLLSTCVRPASPLRGLTEGQRWTNVQVNEQMLS
jgi:hypothetical protein